ncbi:HET-domain-containing protein [Xylaria venustula]|nr:HET-domain-containing protein [Xylaria venustula]
MVCDVCKNLVKDTSQQSRIWLEFTPEELYSSVHHRNCFSCAILLKGIILMQAEGWSFEHDVSKVYGYGIALETDTLALEIYFHDERPRIILEYFIVKGSDYSYSAPWKAIQPRTSIHGDALSEASLQWVKSLIELCIEKHASPCSDHTQHQLPSRILVIERAFNGEILIKLAETPTAFGKYATLSHCWGKQLSCTTTLGNINDRKYGIPWTELLATFQDAILYSATQSSNDSVRFLRRSDTTHKEYYWHEVADNRTYHLGIRSRLPHWSTTDLSHLELHYPLLTRAWVFQERNLSPRILHFCKQELVWECAQAMRCECGGLTNSSNLKMRFHITSVPKRNGAAMPYQCENHLRSYWGAMIRNLFSYEFLSAWNHAVSEYSSLKLTKEEDRFPAILGLAALMQPYMETYRAGLWESSMICGLTWRVDVLKPGARRPLKYKAPTWSWASVNSRVKYWTEEELIPLPGGHQHNILQERERSRHYERDLVVQQRQRRTIFDENLDPSTIALEVCVETEEGNPFGQVLSGIIIVEGILQSGKVRWNHAYFPVLDAPRFTVELFSSKCPEVSPFIVPFHADYVLNGWPWTPASAPTVYLLTLCPCIGLVLERTPLDLKDCHIYRRMGILRLPFEFHEAYGISLTAGHRIKLGII